jgi:hypothetical protein
MGALSLFWDLLLELQASGLTHAMRAGHKPSSNGKTLVSHTLPLALPAQPTRGQPGLARQAEPNPGSQDFFAIMETFLQWGKNAFPPIDAQIIEKIVPACLQRPERLGTCSFLFQKA